MKEIYITKEIIALVDDEDYPLVSKYTWYLKKAPRTYYAITNHKNESGFICISMHRLITGFKGIVDHINGSGVDNRKSNLRVCEHKENMRNMKTSVINTSGYKGVYFEKSSGKWKAQIGVDYKRINLGRFTAKEKAAKAYNIAALEHFGEFAKLNVIKD